MFMRQFNVSNTNNQTIVTTTELAVGTLTIGSTNGPSVPVSFNAIIEATSGTGTTALRIRIRRGTDITGTVVVDSTPETALGGAGNAAQYVLEGSDVPGDVGGQAYTLTIQQTGATANGTVTYAYLGAIVGP